jgi:hypothetical protein
VAHGSGSVIDNVSVANKAVVVAIASIVLSPRSCGAQIILDVVGSPAERVDNCSAPSSAPKLTGMQVEIVTALVLIGLSSHIAIQHRHGVKQERRESAQRRLGGLSRHNEVPAGYASDYSRYYVPVGLRLEQARRVIREARVNDNEDIPLV